MKIFAMVLALLLFAAGSAEADCSNTDWTTWDQDYGPVCLYGDCATYGTYHLYYWREPNSSQTWIHRRMWMSNYGGFNGTTCQDVTPTRPTSWAPYVGPIDLWFDYTEGYVHIKLWHEYKNQDWNRSIEYKNS